MYVLEMRFLTYGDYIFKFMPYEMTYDSSIFEFYLKKQFNNWRELKDYYHSIFYSLRNNVTANDENIENIVKYNLYRTFEYTEKKFEVDVNTTPRDHLRKFFKTNVDNCCDSSIAIYEEAKIVNAKIKIKDESKNLDDIIYCFRANDLIEIL